MSIRFRTIYLPENQGHGNARRTGIRNCSCPIVALMDSDDISLPDRFARQIPVFSAEPETVIVGGQITEFIGSPDHIIGKRAVPERDREIKAYMKKRCPMNQVSVAFRKEFVQSVGGYLDWYCEEDYYLWIRMALAGGIFRNVPDTLVNVRIGDEMSARRGGWKYFRSEAGIQKLMLQKGMISLPRFLYNVAVRFGGEVLIPSRLRTGLFSLLRKSAEDAEQTPVCPVSETEDIPPFSVAMCVYGGDRPDWFQTAVESILNQSVKPEEIVLVVDGPVPPELQNVITEFETAYGREQ